MSFLYPLYLLGMAAIAVPIILHLTQKVTKEEIPFSTLMFLSATPVKSKKASRLENWLLLFLRCLILALLAFAFARPFFEEENFQKVIGGDRQLTILIDTSASMRRDGFWEKAKASAKGILKNAKGSDRVAFYQFDSGIRPLLSFQQWEAGAANGDLVSLGVKLLEDIELSWGNTAMGEAILYAVGQMEEDLLNELGEERSFRKRDIILISDFQEGAGLEDLAGIDWPEDIELVLRSLDMENLSNASLQWVAGESTEEKTASPNDFLRVRVSNSSGADRTQFKITWDASGSSKGRSGGGIDRLDVHVPGGQSRVFRVPVGIRKKGISELRISGDDHAFDNTLYIAPRKAKEVNILYLGNEDPNDANEAYYYVSRALQDTADVSPRIHLRNPKTLLKKDELDRMQLIVVSDILSLENILLLKERIREGGTLLFLMNSKEKKASWLPLCPDGSGPLEAVDISPPDYVLFGEMDRGHPLFAPFVDSKYGDFTKISIWRYCRVNMDGLQDTSIIASFDNGDPAWLHATIGEGDMYTFTSAWNPRDSQLALSTKFVPLLYSFIRLCNTRGEQSAQHFVGDALVPYFNGEGKAADGNLRIVDSRDEVYLDHANDIAKIAEKPGIYRLVDKQGEALQYFAVNIHPDEAKTGPMKPEKLLQLTALGPDGAEMNVEEPKEDKIAQTVAYQKQLEGKQKVWRMILWAVLFIVLLETLLAGIRSRNSNLSPVS